MSLGELTRFLTIQHRLKVTPSEFDADDLMDFQQFLFDEYKYVEKHKSLYDMFSARNIPTEKTERRAGYRDCQEERQTQHKYKGEEFRHQQDNQEKDRIIRQKDSIIYDYRERIGH